MIDKWFDMMGLYDFLGVICPGIFFVGSIILVAHYNLSIVSGNIVDKYIVDNLKYINVYLYTYFIVCIYVAGSFVHEMGHLCALLHKYGLIGSFVRILMNIIPCLKKFLFTGYGRIENHYLIENFSNSTKRERKIWFAAMIRADFCNNEDKKYFEIGKNLDECKKENKKRLGNVSNLFYQHCKRVVSLKGFGASSKKKESIYGFSRNTSFVFWALGLSVIIAMFQKSPKAEMKYMLIELIVFTFLGMIFRIKSIRYKNMEIVDVMRTYRYLVEDSKNSKKEGVNNIGNS